MFKIGLRKLYKERVSDWTPAEKLALPPGDEYLEEYERFTEPTNTLDDAKVVSSQAYWDHYSLLHYPVLDLDVDHAYFPSTTPGHGHLHINKAVPWEHYVELLKVMAKCGILEENYVDVSIRKGYTAVRLPWIEKV